MLLIGCAIEFCPSSQIHSSLFNSSLMEANFSDLQPLGAPRSSLFVHSHLYIFTQKMCALRFSCSEFICNSLWPFFQIGSGQIELYSCQKCTFEVWLVVSEFSLRHEPFFTHHHRLVFANFTLIVLFLWFFTDMWGIIWRVPFDYLLKPICFGIFRWWLYKALSIERCQG